MNKIERLKDWLNHPTSQTDTMPAILHWGMFEDDHTKMCETLEKLLAVVDAAMHVNNSISITPNTDKGAAEMDQLSYALSDLDEETK